MKRSAGGPTHSRSLRMRGRLNLSRTNEPENSIHLSSQIFRTPITDFPILPVSS
jgi:hypothetical protein